MTAAEKSRARAAKVLERIKRARPRVEARYRAMLESVVEDPGTARLLRLARRGWREHLGRMEEKARRAMGTRARNGRGTGAR